MTHLARLEIIYGLLEIACSVAGGYLIDRKLALVV
jgi:hypothetical protein